MSTGADDANPSGHAALVSTDPFLLLVPWGGDPQVHFLESLAERCRDKEVTFLLTSVWHCGTECLQRKSELVRHFARFPRHNLVFLANSHDELEGLEATGLTSLFLNTNIFVPDEDFRPLPNATVEFDAIYNARLLRWKRHDLASELDSVSYVCTYNIHKDKAEASKVLKEIRSRGPGHIIANDVDDGFPVWMERQEVNRLLAQSAVGLCLSKLEGQMRASIEYLCAGLPVVSTPSQGGRDVFFDPDYCIIAEPESRAVRDAVHALRDRQIPREYIRSRTLAKLRCERDRFLAYVDSYRERFGVRRQFNNEWPYSKTPILKWRQADQHAQLFFTSKS